MGFSVTGLTDYVNEQRLPLLKKATLEAPTMGLINMVTGVKGTTALNIIDSEPVIQDGSSCGWNASGSTVFSQRDITVNLLKVEDSLCQKDLQKKWMNNQIRNTAGFETMPFEAEIMDSIVTKIKEKNETGLWQETSKYKGLLYHIEADATEVVVTGITGSVATINYMYMQIPVAVLPKAQMFVGYDIFRQYVMDLTAANLYHYNPKDDAMGFMIPGTNTKIVPVNGLNDTERIVVADPMNLYFGVDFEGDAETFDLWYSKDNDEFRYRVVYSLGTQVAFPAEVIWCEF